jgi:hypothetical protein
MLLQERSMMRYIVLLCLVSGIFFIAGSSINDFLFWKNCVGGVCLGVYVALTYK